MKYRRVVTGHSSNGKAVVASDSEVVADTVAMLPESEFYRLWGADSPPQFPGSGSQPKASNFFPPLGGFRFLIFTAPPDSIANPASGDQQILLNELESKLPGVAAHLERDSPGMHTTDSIDFEYIISGEVWLELDDGKVVHLRAGDTVVQNGTRHAWRNRGSEPCRIVAFLVGAHRHPSGVEVARSANT
jgi:mannose-6-phosphate isomerase-like protein (cupin superfamily)